MICMCYTQLQQLQWQQQRHLRRECDTHVCNMRCTLQLHTYICTLHWRICRSGYWSRPSVACWCSMCCTVALQLRSDCLAQTVLSRLSAPATAYINPLHVHLFTVTYCHFILLHLLRATSSERNQFIDIHKKNLSVPECESCKN